MKSLTQISLSLAAAVLLLACAEQSNAVNVSIDPELLQNLAGGRGAGNSSDAPDETNKPTPSGIDVAPEVQRAIFQAIDDNANALNVQDLRAYYQTLHPDSQFTALMPDVYYVLTTQYQTRYNILDKSIQSQSEDSASVLVRRRTSDTSGTLNQEILYTMRTFEGDWRIFFMTDQSNAF